jgi:DNA-binding IclR family transcriptional regulator
MTPHQSTSAPLGPWGRARRALPPSPAAAPRAEAYYASRTLQALELLAFQDLSCPQLAATMQIHPRTARRLLLRLTHDGYIEQSRDRRRRYRATLRLAALGAQLINHDHLPRIAAPHVAQLHARTGTTAHLMIPSYRHVACVLHCEHPPTDDQPLEPMLRELLPAHATAAGKVLLAHRQPWRDSILTAPLTAYTERTTTTRSDIELDAARTRERGYAIDHAEHHPDTLAIAAPILTNQHATAAIAITTTQHDHADHSIQALAEHVTATAALLTKALARADEHRSQRRR